MAEDASGVSVPALINKTPVNTQPDHQPGVWIIRRGQVVLSKTKAAACHPERVDVFGAEISLEAANAEIEIGVHKGTVADQQAILVKKLSQYG